MRFWKFNKAKAPSPQPAPPKNQEQIIGDKADVDIQIGTAIAGMKTLDELDSLRLYLIDQYPSRSDFIKRATNDRRARISEAEKKRKEQADRNPAPPPPPPQPLPQSSVHVGEVIESTDRRKPRHLRLDAKLRNRHLYLIGKTRTGKTTLIKNLLIQDMEEGRGVGFIDPHGDAALELLGNVPQSRVNDVIYFDPTSEFSPAFNPLQLPYSPPKLAEDMISVFKMFFGDSWGFRLEHLLRYALLTLIADKEPRTVRDLRSIFLNEKLRTRFTQNLTNQSLIEFWENEFPTMPKGSTLPIINKLSAFLAPMSDLERIFSTPQNDLNFSDISLSRTLPKANSVMNLPAYSEDSSPQEFNRPRSPAPRSPQKTERIFTFTWTNSKTTQSHLLKPYLQKARNTALTSHWQISNLGKFHKPSNVGYLEMWQRWFPSKSRQKMPRTSAKRCINRALLAERNKSATIFP